MSDPKTPFQRHRERLMRDPAVNELARLCNAMGRLQYRISQFRAAHANCRVRGRGRCLLCADLDSDFSGSDPWDLLAGVHATLATLGSMLDTDRPFANVDEPIRRRRNPEAATAAKGGYTDE